MWDGASASVSSSVGLGCCLDRAGRDEGEDRGGGLEDSGPYPEPGSMRQQLGWGRSVGPFERKEGGGTEYCAPLRPAKGNAGVTTGASRRCAGLEGGDSWHVEVFFRRIELHSLPKTNDRSHLTKCSPGPNAVDSGHRGIPKAVVQVPQNGIFLRNAIARNVADSTDMIKMNGVAQFVWCQQIHGFEQRSRQAAAHR